MISIIIPVLNAEKYMKSLLDMLHQQTMKPDEIIIIDSESDDNTVKICTEYDNVKVISVKRGEFDHGRTRDIAFRQSIGDVVVFLTQDALPANTSFLQNIVDFLYTDAQLAVVSGRQLARSDASPFERLVREYNYPKASNIRSKADISKFGIKTYYCTDVCAAYRKDIYLLLGGFEYPLKTNEDMFFAAKAIQSGYKVGYAAEAEVFHSHNFTFRQQYERNYIQGYEIARHSDLLGDVSADSEGIKMAKSISLQLIKKCDAISFIKFVFDCFARVTGNKNGKHAAISELNLNNSETR